MISFIVPVFNESNMVFKFLQNVAGTQPWDEYEVLFVDNGSQQPTQQVLTMLKQRYTPIVQVVRNERNEGFGPANNIGAEHAQNSILVFTQPDVDFEGSVVPAVQRAVDNDDTLYGARLLASNTGWNSFGELVIPYIEGWFIACTKSCFQRLGGFDPIYVPADFEDIDLSYTAVKAGMQLQELKLPVAHRHMGASGWDQLNVNRGAITTQHRELFRKKWGL